MMVECIKVCGAEYSSQVESAGFAVATDIVAEREILAMTDELRQLSDGTIRTRQRRVYAARNLLSSSESVRALASSITLRALTSPVLGPNAFPVRAILFDKLADANWSVSWHQDCVIPVLRQLDVAGFSGWSIKHGVPHVNPPAGILERMLTLRIHLDDCGPANGPLRVVPGTHLRGFLTREHIEAIVAHEPSVTCSARRGSVLAMRPLLLHASSAALAPAHRRVVHIEYAAEPLPGGLEWPARN